jgi:K+-sensing histidine kinase KdpD
MLIGVVAFAALVGLVIVGLLLSIRHQIGVLQSATSRNSRDIRDNSQDIRDSNDLVATHVSHELRTPLTTITGTLATLEKNRDRISPEQQCDMLRAAMQQAEVLESLITGMISLEPSEENEGTALQEDTKTMDRLLPPSPGVAGSALQEEPSARDLQSLRRDDHG